MKKLGVISLVFIIIFLGGCSLGSIKVIRGNGNLITSEKSVSSFEKINISGSAEVRFYEGQEYRVIVNVDSNLLEYTEIDTRGNTLNIGVKRGSYSFTKYLVVIYCPVLNSVSISGSGRFIGMDSINVSAFISNISGSGRIEGKIYSDTFSAKISGSGKIIVTGNGKDSDIDISGSGSFNGNEFSINKAAVHISGSGKANINVSENLNVNISGSGVINYHGDPKIDSKVSGFGRLRKLKNTITSHN
jgi:hypothetical protein